MPQIIITRPFKFAHGGHQVEAFEPGETPVETSDECAEVAIAEGWATAVQTSAEPPPPPAPAEADQPQADKSAIETAAAPAAPSNRAAKPSRSGQTGA